MLDDETFSERLAMMTRFAREQIAHPQSGNWFSMDVHHGDWSCQYVWYWKDGAFVTEQCDNLLVIPDLNLKSRAEKTANYGTKPDRFISKVRHVGGRITSRWAVVKELVKWLWKKGFE